MRSVLRAALAVAILALSSFAALADDWVAVRLRGSVLQLVDGQWAPLRRGDVVPDSRVIRTLRSGNVEFQRGQEHVTLAGDTQIQIYDKARAKPFTTVKQYFGTVTIEAEVRDVQHFAVQTQYLAAVVKGTKFTVTSGDSGASVKVERGSVFVEDNATKNNVTVTAGQSAAVGKSDGKLSVSGKASKPASKSDKPGKGKSEKADTPAVGKPDDRPVKPGKDDKPGKSDDDNSGKGKSDDDDHSGPTGHDDDSSGPSGEDDDNSGPSNDDDDDDDSGHGKSGDDDNSGKGKPK